MVETKRFKEIRGCRLSAINNITKEIYCLSLREFCKFIDEYTCPLGLRKKKVTHD